MKCHICGSGTSVKDSRMSHSGSIPTVWRRRYCGTCDVRFSTIESVIPTVDRVLKRDGTVEDFNMKKLETSIRAASPQSLNPRLVATRIMDELHMAYLHNPVPTSKIRTAIQIALASDAMALIRYQINSSTVAVDDLADIAAGKILT